MAPTRLYSSPHGARIHSCAHDEWLKPYDLVQRGVGWNFFGVV